MTSILKYGMAMQSLDLTVHNNDNEHSPTPDPKEKGEGFVGRKRVRHPTMLLHCVRTTIQLLGSHDVSVFRYLGVPVPARIFTTLLSFLCFIGQQRSLALF